MAERRMFAKTIVTSDAFLDLPASSRCLYFMLGMVADDDGFVNNPKSIMRQAGATSDDLSLLIAKRFLLTFQSGVVVIKHWCIHNTIQKDRYKETKYLEEKSMLMLDANRAYKRSENDVYTECIQAVSDLEPQIRLSKDNLIQDNKEEYIYAATDTNVGHRSSKVRHKYGRYNNVLLTDEDMERLREEFPGDFRERIERLSEYIESSGKRYKSHLATIRSWARKDKAQQKTAKGSSFLDLVEDD